MIQKIAIRTFLGLCIFFFILNVALEIKETFSPQIYFEWVIIYNPKEYQKICVRQGKIYFLLPFKWGYKKRERVDLILCKNNSHNSNGRWMREVEKECPPNKNGYGVCAQDNQLLIDSKGFTDSLLDEIGELKP